MPKSFLMLFTTIAAFANAAHAQDSSPAPGPNPQMQAVLDELKSLGGKPLESLSSEEARKQPSAADAVKSLLTKQGKPTDPETVGKVEDRAIPGPKGDIPARVYTPAGDGPFPVLVYWHGGGWVIADLDTYDASCRALCNAAGCVVVSCHYRQAPEHPFPAAADDAFAAYKWVVDHAAEIGGDAAKIAVAGESAGGNLAAVVTLRARDEGLKPPVHQLLIYPVTDFNFDTPSYREHANAKPLNATMMRWFWSRYLPEPGAGFSPYASPLRANLNDLPPTTVITADIDPLRSEGEAYANKLSQSGVDVEQVNYPGVTHEFFGMGAAVDDAKQAVAKTGERLKAAFGR